MKRKSTKIKETEPEPIEVCVLCTEALGLPSSEAVPVTDRLTGQNGHACIECEERWRSLLKVDLGEEALTDLEIMQIEAALRAAEAGPYSKRVHGNATRLYSTRGNTPICEVWYLDSPKTDGRANAQFLASSTLYVAKLLREVKRLRRKLKENG